MHYFIRESSYECTFLFFYYFGLLDRLVFNLKAQITIFGQGCEIIIFKLRKSCLLCGISKSLSWYMNDLQMPKILEIEFRKTLKVK